MTERQNEQVTFIIGKVSTVIYLSSIVAALINM